VGIDADDPVIDDAAAGRYRRPVRAGPVLLAAFGARVTRRSILTVPPARLNGGRLAGPSGHFSATPSRVLGAAVVPSEGLSVGIRR
jgi:hypothetical protein